jgi:hypothetical protein
MVNIKDYAALSAHIYNDQRGGGGPSPVRLNTLDLPTGWSKLDGSTGFPAQTSYDANIFSFTAGAYVNSATGEIVVSYKGTDFLLELAGRAWNTVGDMLTDLSGGVGGFVSTAQFVQAATYYQEVKKWAADNGYDASKISFTGHSLGAGIASVMSVWFNRSATIFADAPFELTAQSTIAQAAVSTAFLLKGFSDPEFALYVAAQTYAAGNSIFNSRESLVTNYYNQGEFLQYLRFGVNTVYGTTNPITIGDQPISRALALHSMNLHGACKLTQSCGRTRRASVPARLRARGRGACTTRAGSRQHLGLHATSVATANGLRRSGTATRHVCGLIWLGGVQYQSQDVPSMRCAGNKWLKSRMDSALLSRSPDTSNLALNIDRANT